MATSLAKPNDRANNIDSWCITEFKTSSLSFLWTIKNFSLCTEEAVKSSTFRAKRNNKSEWQLVLFSNGLNSEYRGYISLFLKLVNSFEEKVKANIRFSGISGKGEKFATQQISHIFGKHEEIGVQRFLKRDN